MNIKDIEEGYLKRIATLEAAVKEAKERIRGYEQFFVGDDSILVTSLNQQIAALTASEKRLREALGLIYAYYSDHPHLVDLGSVMVRVQMIAQAALSEGEE